VLVEYVAPDESYEKHHSASRFIFLLFKQSSDTGMVPQVERERARAKERERARERERESE
jgi:hypothetical protein